MPGDSTVLLAKTGKTISYAEVAESFRKVKEAGGIIAIQRSPSDRLIDSLYREITYLRVLNNILSNKR